MDSVNEQISSTEQDQPAALPNQRPVATGGLRSGIMYAALTIVLALSLWQWFDTHRQLGSMQQEMARRLAEMDGSNKANHSLVAQVQESARELSSRMSLAETRYAEIQSQRMALDSMYREFSSSRDETTLAEVEQMLLIASQQLQLSTNVKAALIAMHQADERLKRMNRPALNGLRKTIEQDMDKLRALPGADIPGINLRLDNVITAVDALPLAQHVRAAQETAAPPSDQTGWRKLMQEIWSEVKQLVRIENTQKADLPLLSPTQAFFLRENLKLRLLSARLSLLAHDDAAFKRDLQAALEWITNYFDVKSSQSAQVVATLQKLIQSNITIEIPDISASLAAVRNFRVTR